MTALRIEKSDAPGNEACNQCGVRSARYVVHIASWTVIDESSYTGQRARFCKGCVTEMERVWSENCGVAA